MFGETDLKKILETLEPRLNEGEFAFCPVESLEKVLAMVNLEQILFFFKEGEAYTIIIEKRLADTCKLSYTYVASWITLIVHSSLESVGLTAMFSVALANEGISCNVVAATFHDHIFVRVQDAHRAMKVLNDLSKSSRRNHV
jgi:hypothetical protein